MKKFAISLLALAIVFAAAAGSHAAIGARAQIAATNGSVTSAQANYLVIGLNNIDVLFHYSNASKDLTGAADDTTLLAIGGTYYFAKMGAANVGGQLLYTSSSTNSNNSANSIKLGLDVNAEIVRGVSLGVTGYVFETNGGKNAGTDRKGSDLGVWSSAQVYLQVAAF